MRKILLLSFILVLALSLGVNAQTFAKKGILEAGGSASFSSTTAVANGQSASNSLSLFSISPNFGYFIIDNLELGAVISFTSTSYSGNSTTLFSGAALVNYCFDTQSKVYPFIGGELGYNTESDGGSASGLLWNIQGGIDIQVENNVLVKVGAFYEQMTLNPSGNTGGRYGSNIFGVQAGFSVFFDTNK